MKLKDALEGYWLEKRRILSKHTVKDYAVGEGVTAVCTSATPGTVCFANSGKKLAFSCRDGGFWCRTLAPGGDAAGWWSAWDMVKVCP